MTTTESGVTRSAVKIGKYAIKTGHFPFLFYENRKKTEEVYGKLLAIFIYIWQFFRHLPFMGDTIKRNRIEAIKWRVLKDDRFLCPTLFSFFGLFNVMPWISQHIEDDIYYQNRDKGGVFTEIDSDSHRGNRGVYKGEVVLLDYADGVSSNMAWDHSACLASDGYNVYKTKKDLALWYRISLWKRTIVRRMKDSGYDYNTRLIGRDRR